MIQRAVDRFHLLFMQNGLRSLFHLGADQPGCFQGIRTDRYIHERKLSAA